MKKNRNFQLRFSTFISHEYFQLPFLLLSVVSVDLQQAKWEHRNRNFMVAFDSTVFYGWTGNYAKTDQNKLKDKMFPARWEKSIPNKNSFRLSGADSHLNLLLPIYLDFSKKKSAKSYKPLGNAQNTKGNKSVGYILRKSITFSYNYSHDRFCIFKVIQISFVSPIPIFFIKRFCVFADDFDFQISVKYLSKN